MSTHGKFLTELVLVDVGNGKHYILHHPLRYRTRGQAVIEVPIGFVTDLASIPRGLWNFFPKTGGYSWAAVLHDYLYRNDSVPLVHQRTADELMKQAMEDSPHPPRWLTRQIIYLGLRVGGEHAFHQHPVAWRPAGLETVEV